MKHCLTGGIMNAALRNATYEDLLRVPDNLIAEILDGELITSPRPASAHALTAWAIGQDAGPFSRRLGGGGGPGGWWILFEPELHLGADILVPDLAGWRRERMPVLGDVPYFELAPDWVCEVLSTSTARVDRIRKKPIYARERVSHLWLVDPSVHTLEVYRLDGGRWVDAGAYGGAEVIRAEPFAAIEMDMRQWWLPGEEEESEETREN
jgi:Uma2 family endonuclease